MTIAENNFIFMLGSFKEKYTTPSFNIKVGDNNYDVDEYQLRWIMMKVSKGILDAKTLNITCNNCNNVLQIREDGYLANDCNTDCKGNLSIASDITVEHMLFHLKC